MYSSRKKHSKIEDKEKFRLKKSGETEKRIIKSTEKRRDRSWVEKINEIIKGTEKEKEL